MNLYIPRFQLFRSERHYINATNGLRGKHSLSVFSRDDLPCLGLPFFTAEKQLTIRPNLLHVIQSVEQRLTDGHVAGC